MYIPILLIIIYIYYYCILIQLLWIRIIIDYGIIYIQFKYFDFYKKKPLTRPRNITGIC